MKTFIPYFLLSLLIIFASCEQKDLEPDDPAGSLENQEGYSLSIPEGFNFSTERKVSLNITDASPYVRYHVFGYSSTFGSEAESISDAFNNLLYTGEPYNGSANFELSISNIYDKVYVSRNDGVESSFEIIDISNNNINISHRSVNTPSNTTKGNRGNPTTELYYPGGTNNATIAFEDLWPSQGDYDFNDLVISYRVVFHVNGGGILESMDYIYDITNIGAAYNNGFGIEFPWPAEIYTVTGQRDDSPGPFTSPNGSTVIFFFEANLYLHSPQILTITFNTEPSVNEIPPPPYNPFLIENFIESLPFGNLWEVHLPNLPYIEEVQPTMAPGFAPSFAQANNDVNGDYVVDPGVELNVPPLTDMERMPWAINIAGTFVPPLPGEFIMKGHLKFLDWAQSGGLVYPDWFMDASGYRDSNYLEAPIITPPSPAAVGDLRAGGIVFWVDPLDNTKGLVCALIDTGQGDWGCQGDDLNIPNVQNFPPSGPGADIGSGKSNTDGILQDCPSTTNAASMARALGPDWFLPSINELNEMWVNRDIINGRAVANGGSVFHPAAAYWSSTEFESEAAWAQDFAFGNSGDGDRFPFDKEDDYKPLVRAVRAF